jgi:hypothetical protein
MIVDLGQSEGSPVHRSLLIFPLLLLTLSPAIAQNAPKKGVGDKSVTEQADEEMKAEAAA